MSRKTLDEFRQEVCEILVEEFEFSTGSARDAFTDYAPRLEDAHASGVSADDAVVDMIMAMERAYDPYREFIPTAHH